MAESIEGVLRWINELLKTNYTDIKDLGTGAAYCQILDSIYGDVQMNKVKFDANQEFQYVSNYKVLQTAFNKHGIDNVIPVERLMKRKVMDNLEFSQWLKKFWTKSFTDKNYNPIARRNSTYSSNAMSRNNATNDKSQAAECTGIQDVKGNVSSEKHVGHVENSMKMQELFQTISDLRYTVESMEHERDFYFGKLREIEDLIQKDETARMETEALLEATKKILYSNNEL